MSQNSKRILYSNSKASHRAHASQSSRRHFVNCKPKCESAALLNLCVLACRHKLCPRIFVVGLKSSGNFRHNQKVRQSKILPMPRYS